MNGDYSPTGVPHYGQNRPEDTDNDRPPVDWSDPLPPPAAIDKPKMSDKPTPVFSTPSKAGQFTRPLQDAPSNNDPETPSGNHPAAGAVPAGNDNLPSGNQPETKPASGDPPAGTEPSPGGNLDHHDQLHQPAASSSTNSVTSNSQTEKPLNSNRAHPTRDLPDHVFDIPIDEIILQLGKAKVVREERTIRGYCESGEYIHCRLRQADDNKQIKYHSYQSSIDKLITHLKSIDAKRAASKKPTSTASQPAAGAVPAGNDNLPSGNQPETDPAAGDPPSGSKPLPAGTRPNERQENQTQEQQNDEEIARLRSELLDAQVTSKARKQTLTAMGDFYEKRIATLQEHHTQEIKKLAERAVTAENELARLQSPEQ